MNLSVNTPITRKNANVGGLIGGFFQFAVGGQVYGLSCNHVIADINQCRVGDELTDGNNSPVGSLSHWLILDDTILNKAEFALFKPGPGYKTVWIKSDESFKPEGFIAAALNDTVDFVYNNETRHGKITSIGYPVSVKWNNRNFHFKCIQVQSMPDEQFSKPGHSGGAVYKGNYLLGIILGISTDKTKTYLIPYVNGILSVVDLKIV